MKKTISVIISIIIILNCCFLTCFAANAVSGDDEIKKDFKTDEKLLLETADDWLSDFFEDEPYDVNELFDYGKFIRLYSRGMGLFEKETLNAQDIADYIERYNNDYYYFLPVIDRGTTIYLNIQGPTNYSDEEVEYIKNNNSKKEAETLLKDDPWSVIGADVYPYELDFKQELYDILEHNKIDNSVSYIFPLNSMSVFMFAAVCLENGEVKFALLDYKVDELEKLVNENDKHTGRTVEPLDGYEFPVDYRLYTFEEMKEMLSEDLDALEYVRQHPGSEITGYSAGGGILTKSDNAPSVLMQIVYSLGCVVLVIACTLTVILVAKRKRTE